MDALQYFHYGQLVHHGEPTGDMRVLAKTSGVSDEDIELALQYGKIPPLVGSKGVAWGVIRTQRGKPMILGRADQNSAGILSYQFVMMPSDILRKLAGNLQLLQSFFNTAIPTYEMLGDTLKPLPLRDDPAPTTDEQVDGLLNLMSYTRNNTRNIQPLIATVVNGNPLVVINASKVGEERAGFVQGLLSLIPASTRFGVTFLLNATQQSSLRAQIMFMEEPLNDPEATIYDWSTGKVSGNEVTNDYSKFIVSQMRLDPELVTRETEKLTPTAGWRFNSGDNLGEALDYASHRMKVDRSVQNGLPVEVSTVSKILAEDPTINDELRLQYSRHLLKFSLALDDLTHLDAVTATMHQNPAMEDEVYQEFAIALADNKGSLIFETLVRWKDNPFSPHGPKWVQLMQTAAMAEIEELVAAKDIVSISEYLDDVQLLGADAELMVPRLIDRIAPLAELNEEIPPKLLLLAFQHLDEGRINSLLKSARFVRPLPRNVKQLLALFSQPDRKAPRGVIVSAVGSVPEEARDAAMLQFAKMSYVNKRLELIDERVLKELTRIMLDPHFESEQQVIASMALAINDHTLAHLRHPAPRYILQLILEAKRYDMLAKTMTMQARDIYKAEGQRDYIRSVQQTFSQTKISPKEMAKALDISNKTGLKGVPMIAAICGALESSNWAEELNAFARKAMLELEADIRHLKVMPSSVIMNLLRYQIRRGDVQSVQVVSRLVASCNAYDPSKEGLNATNQAYKLLESTPKTRPIALDVVRQYVREAEEKPAQHMMKVFSQRMGKEVGDKLQLSNEFSNMLGRVDLLTYAHDLQITVDILQSLVDAYDKSGKQPDFKTVRQLVEDVRRYIDIATHRQMAEDVRQMAHDVVILGDRHNRRSSNSDRHLENVAKGETDPRSILDVYRSAGGYLLSKTVYPLRIKEGNPNAPFGLTDLDELVARISVASNLIHQATIARPSSRDQWSAAMIADEINSHTQALIGDNRDTLRQMGRNWQRLTDLILKIHKDSDTKVIEQNNNLGRKLDIQDAVPKDVMQLFRFTYGFFIH